MLHIQIVGVFASFSVAEIVTPAGSVHVHFDGYAPPMDADNPKMSYVVDGDTIRVGGQSWRLYGIDAPPIDGHSSSKPHCPVEAQMGAAAKEALSLFIADGYARQTLRFEIRHIHEKYFRHLVDVYVDGVSVADHLIGLGLAYPYTGKAPKQPFCRCPSAWAKYEAEIAVHEARAADQKVRRANARRA